MLTAFEVVLAGYTGELDVMVTVPDTGLDRVELEDMTGCPEITSSCESTVMVIPRLASCSTGSVWLFLARSSTVAWPSTALSIDPEYPADRVAYMLRDASCRLVIVEDGSGLDAAVLGEGVSTIRIDPSADPGFPDTRSPNIRSPDTRSPETRVPEHSVPGHSVAGHSVRRRCPSMWFRRTVRGCASKNSSARCESRCRGRWCRRRSRCCPGCPLRRTGSLAGQAV
jgi:hypothetical protein